MACYRDEHLSLAGEVLFPWVDQTVLMTTEGSPRRAAFMRELLRFRPTRRVVIQVNTTFARCLKPGIRSAAEDIVHSTRRALRFGGYTLLLEDDVEFHPRVRRVAKDIRVARDGVFSLGASLILAIPGRFPHVLLGAHAHALLFGPVAAAELRVQPQRTHLDFWLPLIVQTRTYWQPLAAQKLVASPASGQLVCRQLQMALFAADRDPWRFYAVSHACAQLGGFAPALLLVLGLGLLAVGHARNLALWK